MESKKKIKKYNLKFIFINSAFRKNMHGSVCLFSKYLQHLLEGENLDELNIASASSKNNILKNKNSLSTGWTGTCPALQLFTLAQADINSEMSSLNTIISSNHQKTMNAFDSANNLISKLFTVSTINVSLPSGATYILTPNFESEFRDITNTSSIGGKIYYDFNNKLKYFVEKQHTNIQNSIAPFINTNNFQSSFNQAYSNFVKFDTAVATASNVMNNRILDLKDYFLTLQFLLMFFTWGYLIFFVAIGVIYVIYLCKEYKPLYYVLFIITNIIFVLILLEIFLASFFGQVRLICHEVPRAMNFIFTGNYMVSGNSGSYPAQFGRGDANMTKMFTTCLKGDGDLVNLFITSSDLSSFDTIQKETSSLNAIISDEIHASNLALNNYNSLSNSILLKTINKYEIMKENLFLASEGFGKDEIYKIISNIRTNLDSENCSQTYEYYVIRESDCPSGSIIMTTISPTSSGYHCYVIQNLSDSTTAGYSGSSCDNNYINNAIKFIKQIDSLLDSRLEKIKNFQIYYSTTYKNLYDEVYSISNIINNTYNTLNNDLKNVKNISNCGSVRYDLIDFCDFIGVTTEYDARIVVIFSSFLGVFGFVMLYGFLVVLNGFTAPDNDYDNDDYGYNYESNKMYKNININVNKSKNKKDNYNNNENEQDEDDDNNIQSFKKKREKTPPKTGQKVEMSYMSKNSEDSD